MLAEHDVRIFNQRARGDGQLAVRLRDTEALVLIRERTRVSASLLARLPRLRLLSQTGKIGPHIDLDACTRQGIAVAESQGQAASTAEFTWLLILAALRRLPAYMANLYAGHWQRSVPPRPHWPLAGFGESLSGKTLGIWGYGRIGRIVAGYGRAFGMEVLIHGRANSLTQGALDGHQTTAERTDFFARSDVVTLHLRLLNETRGCVSANELRLMKPTALLVNTSRAELIEPGALVSALTAGRPGLAAIDVYEREPIPADEPLLRLPNAICTPHLGFTERRSYERLLSGAFGNVASFARGTPTNVVNDAALKK